MRLRTKVFLASFAAAAVAVSVATGFVARGLPFSETHGQAGLVWRAALSGLLAGLAAALTFAWTMSALLSQRIDAIANVARRYAAGDLSRPTADYGRDEVATVARVLDHSVHEVGRRLDELARDRALMGAILGGMVEGVLVVDAAGRLQLANEAAREMLGLGDQIAGRHYLEVVRHPGIAARIGGALGDRIAPEAPADSEIILGRTPDRTFVARAAPFSAPRTPAGPGAVLVLHDVTDLKRADRIRRDFVANVSHELRTPLTAIRGYVEALLDDDTRDGAAVDSARRFLEIIQRHAARMERLVRDLLRLARLDAGQEALDLASCAIPSVFADVQADLAPVIERRGHRVTTRIDAGAETVRADPAKLHDIVRNLVENAINHTPDGTAVELTASRGSGGLAITVADTGPGIPAADLPRIFERFYRVDKARSRGTSEGGTGLGLAIVKHLVGLHGGTVQADNRPGGGAVFTVIVPALPSQPSS